MCTFGLTRLLRRPLMSLEASTRFVSNTLQSFRQATIAAKAIENINDNHNYDNDVVAESLLGGGKKLLRPLQATRRMNDNVHSLASQRIRRAPEMRSIDDELR